MRTSEPTDNHPPGTADELVAVVLEEESRRRAQQRERADEGLPGELPSFLAVGAPDRSLRAIVGPGGGPTLGVLCALPFLDALWSTAFVVLAPDIGRSLGLTLTEVGVIGALGALMAAVAAVPFGRLADRRARFGIVAVCAITAAAATAMAGSADTVRALVTCAVVAGLAWGHAGPVQSSLVADAFPIHGRCRAFGLTRGSHALGFALGPGIVGLLASGGDWGTALGLIAVSSAVAGMVAARLRGPRPGRQEMTVALGEELPDTSDHDASPPRAVLNRIRRIPSFAGLTAGVAVVGLHLITVPIFLGTFLQRSYELGTFGRGLVLSLAGTGMVAGAVIGGRQGDHLLGTDPSAVVRRSAGFVAAGGLGASLAFVMPTAVLHAVFLAGSSACTVAGLVLLLGTITSILPYRERGTGLGLVFAYQALFGGVLGAVGIAQIESASTLRTGLVVVTSLGALGAGAWLLYAAQSVHRDIPLALAGLLEEDEERTRVGSGATAPLLQVRNLDFSYGPVQVLFDVSLDVWPGEVLALLGTNGAGKSTLLRAISGLSPIDRGVIRLDGRTISFDEPGDRLDQGIVQLPGGRGVFPSLTVIENLRARGYSVRRKDLDARIASAIEPFPVLGQRLDQPAGSLSGGEQQMLALAGALLLDPRILLIDELSLGLAPVIVQQLLETVTRLKETGLTMVIVEQSVNVALTLADRAVFMEKGQVRFEGPAQELLERDDLVRAVFLGGQGG